MEVEKTQEQGTKEKELVEYDTYKRVLDQRKADQAKARELQAELDRIKAEREEAEAAKLAEQKRFEELYASEKKKAEELASKIKHVETQTALEKKRSALKTALGGVRKDEYLSFADLDSIVILESGVPDPETVKAAANKFREAHPELVASKETARLPNESATGFQAPKGKPLHELSMAELGAMLAASKK